MRKTTTQFASCFKYLWCKEYQYYFLVFKHFKYCYYYKVSLISLIFMSDSYSCLVAKWKIRDS